MRISTPDRPFLSFLLRCDRDFAWTAPSDQKFPIITREAIKEYYPPVYAPSGIIGNLKFALRYEPIDLSIYEALFKVLDAALLGEWIRQEPTGTYVRRP